MEAKVGLVTACALALLAAAPARAQSADTALAQEDRIAELERTVKVLADELERTRSEMVVPAEPDFESRYGFGPAASKVYGLLRGLSIGGYGEAFYKNPVSNAGGQKATADNLRFVLYTGYKFTENIVFNSEVEFEHATTSATESSGAGSVSVEFAALDFFVQPWANARAGLLLLPVGFLNTMHEPPYYFGVDRPEVERLIIPTTWRENGAGLFGSLLGEELTYKIYAVNGFNAKGFRGSGWRNGRQQGNRALAEDMAFAGRLDWTPLPELLFGGSLYLGDSGQDQVVNGIRIPSSFTTLWEVHGEYRWSGLQLRGLFSMTHLQDAGALTRALAPVSQGGIGELSPGEVVARDMLGGYVEIAYDVWPLLFPDSEVAFEPFFRFERVDTQNSVPNGFTPDENLRQNVYTVGFSFLPIPNVVVKADYRNRTAESGTVPDEVNLGIGFAF